MTEGVVNDLARIEFMTILDFCVLALGMAGNSTANALSCVEYIANRIRFHVYDQV